MSDSESSADSMDEFAVTLTKKDGRTKRAEKLKFDLFDKLLFDTNARADVKRRIASVESEIKAESTVDSCKEADSEGGETRADGINGDVNINGAKTEAKTPKANTASKASSIISNNSLQESEDSYWARLDSEIKAKTTKTNPHLNRKRLNDAINGLEYDSEETDDEDWAGRKGPSREERRGEAVARLTGEQCGLGLRNVFRKQPRGGKKNGGQLKFYVFQSRQEALDDLVRVVSKMNETYKNAQSTSDKLIYQYFVRPLSKLIKSSKQNLWGRGTKSIYSFLDRIPITSANVYVGIRCGCDPNCALVIPDLFFQWVWNVACSSLRATSLEAKCVQLLTKFLQNQSSDKPEDQCGFNIWTESLKKFRMGDLATCLVNDFGLLKGPCSPPDTDNKESAGVDVEDDSSVVDISALKKLFVLWISLLEKDFVQLDDSTAENDAIGEGATQDMVALARVCLDPHLELIAQRYNTCGGNMLVDIVQELIASIVDSTTRQITSKYDQKQGNAWLENTSIEIIESCGSFSAGDQGAADSDDKHGYLPLAAVVSNMQVHDDALLSQSISYECALLRIHLAEKALRMCLTEVDDWESQTDALKKKKCQWWSDDHDSGISYLNAVADQALNAFLISAVAFKFLDDNKDELLQNLPLFLAAVHIAGECAMASARVLFRSAEPSNLYDVKTERFVKYTIEQRDIIYEILSSIQDLADSLRAECSRRSVMSYPHLRRAKEYLTRLVKFIEGTKGRSSKDKKQKRRTQGSLDGFFSALHLISSE